ncbi:hypothetical protein [Streptomyces sp. ISL-94]|nr:hypothetical protein [Streptomyces sp. ISL-94]MBT2481867.1 hypothetical protein [Streptomyces sp. ISL-94]
MAIASGDMDKDELLHHLVQDHLWKLGIVAIAAVVVLTAMVVIYKKVGTK